MQAGGPIPRPLDPDERSRRTPRPTGSESIGSAPSTRPCPWSGEGDFQPGPGHIALGAGAGAQQIEVRESTEQAMHRPRLQAQLVGDFGKGQARSRGGGGFENPDVSAQWTVVSPGMWSADTRGESDRQCRSRPRVMPEANPGSEGGFRLMTAPVMTVAGSGEAGRRSLRHRQSRRPRSGAVRTAGGPPTAGAGSETALPLVTTPVMSVNRSGRLRRVASTP